MTLTNSTDHSRCYIVNDYQLILGCQRNDRKSQKELYDNYSRQMYNICLRYCHDKASASDALQEGFIKVFKYVNTYKDSGNLYSWIKKIIVRSCLDQIKKEKAIFSVDVEEINSIDHNYELDLSFDDYTYNKILEVLETIPSGYKLVFSMYVLDELKHSEIASILDITESTSRTQLYKARKIIQRKLSNLSIVKTNAI